MKPAATLNAPSVVEEACAHLRSGLLVVLPTETVYGLAADATQEAAVARVYAAKGRPAHNPLIAHYPDRNAAEHDVVFSPLARDLADAFWPGPLTLVLPVTHNTRLSLAARAQLPTAAVRVPNHPTTQAVLRALGRPVVAPSANRSSRLSTVSVAQAQKSLGDRVALYADGGDCQAGVESTIVRVLPDGSGVVILRAGALSAETLAQHTSVLPHIPQSMPEAPGMLLVHYAPSCPLVLHQPTHPPCANEALLWWGSSQTCPGGYGAAYLLSPNSNLEEAAHRLFHGLHELEASGCQRIVATLVPERGLGIAINDRLRRAAAASNGFATTMPEPPRQAPLK